uniref:Uncharacterized protein n=1 Tax=Populus trichocarpa TaxID=3694 RepID=A0A3N7ECB7_POPTR
MNKQMLKLQRSKKELPGLRWKKSQGIIKHMDMYVQLMVCCLMEVCGEGV